MTGRKGLAALTRIIALPARYFGSFSNWRGRRWRVFGAAFVFFALYMLWAKALPAPFTWTTVTATVEKVEFVVTDRRLAAVPVTGMRFASPPLNGELECLDGLLRPNVGAVVAYQRSVTGERLASGERSIPGAITVTLVSGSAAYEPTAGQGRPITDFNEIVADPSCKIGAPSRFPIWGELRLGDEIRAASTGADEPGLLIDGRLKVQARAIKSPLLVWSDHDAIYQVADIDLPVGSRVESFSDAENPGAWWGTAYYDSQKVGLQVAATTESKTFAIYRPGSTVAENVTITGLTQLFADPNVIRFQAIVLVLLGIVQLVISLSGLWPTPDDRKKGKT